MPNNILTGLNTSASPETRSWMQGFATALEVSGSASAHLAQIVETRRDFGYSSEYERTTSERIVGRLRVRAAMAEVAKCG